MPTAATAIASRPIHAAAKRRPYTSPAARRTRPAVTLRVSRVYAPSSARSQHTLITRGIPDDKRCTSSSAPALNISAEAPATRRRWRT